MDPSEALKWLENKWPFIEEHAHPFVRMKTRVLRARLRFDLEENIEGAAEDAQAALEFCQARNVDSVWSREAGEIFGWIRRHSPQG